MFHQAAGGSQIGERRFLQERIDAPLFVHHVHAVPRTGARRLQHGDTAHPGTLPIQRLGIEGENHVARSYDQPRIETPDPCGRERQHLVENGAYLSPRRCHRHRAEQLSAKGILRQPARIASGMNQQHPLPGPPFREINRPRWIAGSEENTRHQLAQSVQRSSAAAHPPIPKIRDHQVPGMRRNPAIRQPAPDFGLVSVGLLPGTGGDHHSRPPA